MVTGSITSLLMRGCLFEDITTKMEDVRNGLITWVDGVYGDIQAGTIDTGELLTPREQAELTSDDEDFPQALADLQALNIAVDLEREAEIGRASCRERVSTIV